MKTSTSGAAYVASSPTPAPSSSDLKLKESIGTQSHVQKSMGSSSSSAEASLLFKLLSSSASTDSATFKLNLFGEKVTI
jgi:hypothetical protein